MIGQWIVKPDDFFFLIRAVVVRALIDNSHLIDWGLLPKALRGLLALLCGNGYIVGINQIYDIGIDKCVVHPSYSPILL